MGGSVVAIDISQEKLDLAREHPIGQHAVVVGADLGDARPLVQACLRPALLHPPATQRRGRDTVEGGRLVQADEGVGVEPVPADAVPAIDQRHPHVGVVDQRVRERHAHGPGADDEVVHVEPLDHPVTIGIPASSYQGRMSAPGCRAAISRRSRPGRGHDLTGVQDAEGSPARAWQQARALHQHTIATTRRGSDVALRRTEPEERLRRPTVRA